MTRINCIPPSELCDQHLRAEWYELPRAITRAHKIVCKAYDQFNEYPVPFTALLQAQAIPPTYRMGKGHLIFFLDKNLYLIHRLSQIYKEMLGRGMNAKYSVLLKNFTKFQDLPKEFTKNWTPTPEAMSENRMRIQTRLATMEKSPGPSPRWTHTTPYAEPYYTVKALLSKIQTTVDQA